jgi:predicted dehydrogenase
MIGAGFIGPVHVEALRRVGCTVVGVLDATPELGRRAAKQMQVPKAYESLDELLDDASIASVHIASPNRLHYEQALRVLEADKHVVCEKPLAMTSKESKKLVALAQKSGKVAAVNYNLRFYPLCIEARQQVQSGKLGDVFTVVGSYVQDWLLYPTDYNWRVLAEEGGTLRAVADIGTHWLDLIGFITGLEIEEVFADLMTAHPVRKRPLGEIETFSGKGKKAKAKTQSIPVATEDYGTVLLRFKGGQKGSLIVSQTTAGRKNCLRYEMACAKGALAWNSETPNELWIGQRDAPNQTLLRDPALLDTKAAQFASYPGGHNEGFPDTFKQCYREIYSHITSKRKRAPLYATFEDGHRELLLCEAIAKSHRTKKWVKVRS